MRFTSRATSSAMPGSSSEHGPAISVSRPGSMRTGPTVMGVQALATLPPLLDPRAARARGSGRGPFATPALLHRGAHEAAEEWVRIGGPGPKLGVELHPHEPGVLRKLDDLDQVQILVEPRHLEPVLLQILTVAVVEFVPVAVALGDVRFRVFLRGVRAGAELAIVGAEPHGAALLRDPLLGFQEVDHRVRRVGAEFRGIG